MIYQNKINRFVKAAGVLQVQCFNYESNNVIIFFIALFVQQMRDSVIDLPKDITNMGRVNYIFNVIFNTL